MDTPAPLGAGIIGCSVPEGCREGGLCCSKSYLSTQNSLWRGNVWGLKSLPPWPARYAEAQFIRCLWEFLRPPKPCKSWGRSSPSQEQQQDGGRQGASPSPAWEGVQPVAGCDLLRVTVGRRISLRCKKVGEKQPVASEAAFPKPFPFFHPYG